MTHRDLKLENILLDEDNHPKVIHLSHICISLSVNLTHGVSTILLEKVEHLAHSVACTLHQCSGVLLIFTSAVFTVVAYCIGGMEPIVAFSGRYECYVIR